MATQNQVAEKVKGQKVVTVFDFLEQKRDLIAKALPASITPDRIIGVFTMVLRSSPELAACTQTSLIAAVIQTVQLRLTPGNIGHCHFVPFNNKQKDGSWQKEVQFIIGYKGIVELLNRCGKATLLSTEIVHDGDHFEYELGLNPVLKHVPAWDGETMPIRGVYCVAKNLVADEKVFVYMSKEEIDKIKDSSKASGSEYSPWNRWYEEMAKKTVIKRICKLLPLSVDEQKRVATDETIKNEIRPDMTEVRDDASWEGETVDVPPAAPVGDESPAPGQELPEEPSDPQEEAPQSPPAGRSSASAGPAITEKQGKRLYAIAKGSGYSDEQIHAHLKWNWELDSTKDITKGNYEEICAFFEKPNQSKGGSGS